MRQIHHLIDGQPVAGESDRTSPVFNPATGEQTGELSLASAAEVNRAVASAQTAFEEWSNVSIARRTTLMLAFRNLVVDNAEEIAKRLTAEHGKVHADAMGEVARAIDNIEYACGLAEHLKGSHNEMASTGIDVYTVRRPLGVVAGITPFNFPAMVPMWMAPNAIACGNTFVLKPSERDPSAPMFIAELFQEAGFPPGVLNLVNGDKVAVDQLLEHPDVKAISFVGSTPIARYVYTTGTSHGKRVQALGGAKNHMVVLPDADVELAADSAVSAAYGSAGERCMAISVVAAVGDVADSLVDAIKVRMEKLVIGDGTDSASDMGPLITREHRDRVAGYIGSAAEQGATETPGSKTTASFSAYRCWTTSPPAWTRTRTRSSVLFSAWCGVTPMPRRFSSSPTTHGATGPPSSPGTAGRPASSRRTPMLAWWASTSPYPYRWATTRSAAGRTRSSATPRCTAPRESTSIPGPKS